VSTTSAIAHTGAGLSWQPHPDVWLLVAALVGGYLAAVRSQRARQMPRTVTTSHVVCFALGVAALWLAVDWPVDALAAQLLSVHMVQHLLLALVAAPLLILGVPGWLLRRLLRPAPVFAVARVLTRPLPALLIFNAWMVLYHWPAVLDPSVENDLVHLIAHAVWVIAGLIMWWPVLSPLPELPHLSYLSRMVYLFAQSIVPTVPASFLTFSKTSLYASYSGGPDLWGLASLSAITDQQMAGLLMKIGGGLLLWGVILALFLRWFSEEQTGGPDPLYWRDMRDQVETATSDA
jgi:putative membrane protein